MYIKIKKTKREAMEIEDELKRDFPDRDSVTPMTTPTRKLNRVGIVDGMAADMDSNAKMLENGRPRRNRRG
jgi:hypothetical protein